MDVRLDLALAVIDPAGPLGELGPDNEPVGWLSSLEDAVSARVPFFGRPRRDVLAVDCDRTDPDALPAVEASARAFGVELALWASGRPGHAHAFARIPNARLRRDLAGELRRLGLEVRNPTTGGRSSPVRPPGTPHRVGLPVGPISPSTLPEFVALLCRPQGPPAGSTAPRKAPSRPQIRTAKAKTDGPGSTVPARPRKAAQRPRRAQHRPGKPIAPASTSSALGGPMTPTWRAILAADPSGGPERVMSLALSALQDGLTLPELEAEALDPRHPGGLGRCKRGQARAERMIARAWQEAEAYVKANPAHAVNVDPAVFARAQDMKDRAREMHAAGELTTGQRRVAIAFADRCAELGRATIGMSVREVAERAGVDDDTSPAAFHALAAVGLLTRTAPHKGDTPAVWSLPVSGNLSHRAQEPDTQPLPNGPLGARSPAPAASRHPRGGTLGPQRERPEKIQVLGSMLSQDVFRRGGGLGLAGAEVVCALAQSPGVGIGEISAALKKNAGTVRRLLRRAETAGLVRTDRLGRWFAVADPDYARAAEIVGTAGSGERQRRKHEAERRAYAEALEELEHPTPASADYLDESPWPEGARCMRPPALPKPVRVSESPRAQRRRAQRATRRATRVHPGGGWLGSETSCETLPDAGGLSGPIGSSGEEVWKRASGP